MSKQRQGVDLDEVIAAGEEQVGQADGLELLERLVDPVVADGVQDGQPFAAAAVADRGHGEDWLVGCRSPR